MPRYKLTIEYDGADYSGWQRQANGASVQQALEEALFALTGETPVVHGAGRTDAGVHAMGQVAHVDLEREWSGWRLREAINAHLDAAADRRARGRAGRRPFRRAPQRGRCATTSIASSIAARR